MIKKKRKERKEKKTNIKSNTYFSPPLEKRRKIKIKKQTPLIRGGVKRSKKEKEKKKKKKKQMKQRKKISKKMKKNKDS